jgi:hypothetical protein
VDGVINTSLKGGIHTDLIKSLIQQALWKAYETTGDERYNDLYQQWQENYERIAISGLEGRKE